MYKKLIILLVVSLITSVLRADPPDPPVGKRWVLNAKFSDEFNGNKLDATKWYDYHPNWSGREPGIFLPSQVKVGNGYMSITGKKLEKDSIQIRKDGTKKIFNIAGGAVVSKTTDAYFGYYECKFKAAKTTMSTTFWMSTRGSTDGPTDCESDKYGLELDFQECIGREGDFDGKYFARGMNSNSHYWYTDCEGKRHDYRAPQSKIETKTMPSEDFYTYGGWWHNESKVSYFLNDRKVKTVDFYDEITKKPFDKTMGLNMVSETYPFPWIKLPNDEELADPTKNTCYYDWVRVYDLVDIDEKVKNNATENLTIFNDRVYFNNKLSKISSKNNIDVSYSYMSNVDREVLIKLFDENKKPVIQTKHTVFAGFGNRDLQLKLNNKLKNNKTYVAKIFVKQPNGKKNIVTDEFKFVYKK
ncbi:Beta-glucanase, GH16 family [Lutibacter oricola]|uniref:Beta-glucanase, GH16 family n=1 Tax=Lutibacter oricola TaxID=762486 RepID=A0A1H3FEQ3_9FLAO|nr:hypothetical protein [Lutibacter oricola]SDX89471.1 Beta-glucanase, GH16 family [Lutibacter oricola]